jgi:chorismate mutase
MSEHVLIIGTGYEVPGRVRAPAPRGTCRPRSGLSHAEADEPMRADGGDLRALLENLDGQIVAMVLRRAELARHYHALRRSAGLPQSELAWENRVLRRYAELLGGKGTDIGRAVLALSRSAPPRLGPDEMNEGTPRKEDPSARTMESARGDPPR